MSEYIKISGKTVEDALLEASIQLGTSSDNIEYRVLEKESKGFLGLGAKKAVIEARAKKTDEDIVHEVFHGTSATEQVSASKTDAPAKKEPAAAKKPAASAVKKPAPAPVEKKTIAAAEKKAPSPAVKKAAAAEEKPSAPAPKERPAKPHVPADPEEAKRRASVFLADMFKAMNMNVKVTETFEDDTLSIDLEGEDMGMLIGKRGQTLDSIQYLVSLVVNRGKASFVRVKVDTENYRERRKATLENLARNIAFKVKKTRRPVYLEPMNPYERRIIHSALQNDPYVTTHSEGEEPCRKVVVTLKGHDDIQDN